ncbi:unnamed protein product, partial [Heterosigma akashiwo]
LVQRVRLRRGRGDRDRGAAGDAPGHRVRDRHPGGARGPAGSTGRGDH